MKRILALTLAIILVLSCCPSVSATEAEEELGYSEAFANMDPKIKEIIASQLTDEEKQELIALEPSLSGQLILPIGSMSPLYFYGKMSSQLSVNAKENLPACYYLLSESPHTIDYRWGTPYYPEVSVKISKITRDLPFIKDIMNLKATIEINGKSADVTGIYCYGYGGRFHSDVHGITICILTEAGALFKYYADVYSEAVNLSEREFNKYIDDYYSYAYVQSKVTQGQYQFDVTPFSDFMIDYDIHMAIAKEMNAEWRCIQIKQAYSAYWPIALGVVLVTGAAAVGVVLYRKRRKAAIPVEQVADPVDDP